MRFKKADLSINVIIMAVIAVLVLLTLVMIFGKNIASPSKKLGDVSGGINLNEGEKEGCSVLEGNTCKEECDNDGPDEGEGTYCEEGVCCKI